jgi:hypothetical protein
MDGIAPLVGIYTHANVTTHSNLHLNRSEAKLAFNTKRLILYFCTNVSFLHSDEVPLSCQPNTSLAPPGRGWGVWTPPLARPGGRRQAARPVPEEVQAPGACQVRGARFAPSHCCAVWGWRSWSISLAARHPFTAVIPEALSLRVRDTSLTNMLVRC